MLPLHMELEDLLRPVDDAPDIGFKSEGRFPFDLFLQVRRLHFLSDIDKGLVQFVKVAMEPRVKPLYKLLHLQDIAFAQLGGNMLLALSTRL